MQRVYLSVIFQLRVFWSLGLKPWAVVDAYCDTLLGDEALLAQLQGTKFDVSIVDPSKDRLGQQD